MAVLFSRPLRSSSRYVRLGRQFELTCSIASTWEDEPGTITLWLDPESDYCFEAPTPVPHREGELTKKVRFPGFARYSGTPVSMRLTLVRCGSNEDRETVPIYAKVRSDLVEHVPDRDRIRLAIERG